MSSNMTGIGLIVLAVVILGVAGAAAYGINVARNKVRSISRAMFGTSDLAEGIRNQADVLAETPKSVNGMTKLMEPLIRKDFPDFNWDEFRHKAENMLTSALTAISTGDVNKLTPDASEDVKQQIVNRINDNLEAEITEHYGNIKIHRTEIANYKHEGGKCIITIQSAVGYDFYREQRGQLIEGSRERKTQTKYNVELLYIQDASVVEYDNAMGTICPHCGAPVKNIGNMYCEFCGSGIVPLNIKVWSLHKFYEVDYNHM